MRKRLRVVAELLAGVRIDLFAHKPKIVGVRQQPLEHFGGFVQLAQQYQVVAQPERADVERAFIPGYAVVEAPIAIHEPLRRCELALRGANGGEHPRVVRLDEADERQHQVGGVQQFAAVCLHEHAAPLVESLRQDLFANFAAHLAPALHIAGQPQRAHHLDGAVKRYPAPRLGEYMMLPFGARLPYAFVGFAPVVKHKVDHMQQIRPVFLIDRADEAAIQMRRIHKLAVCVQLKLRISAVADAHRT